MNDAPFAIVEVDAADLDELQRKADEAGRLREALVTIELLYYLEDRDARWRAAAMNGVARDAVNDGDWSWAKKFAKMAAGAEAYVNRQLENSVLK